eukprot:scaffold45681_cov199-Amphora_coffeaeformis.AAC.2
MTKTLPKQAVPGNMERWEGRSNKDFAMCYAEQNPQAPRITFCLLGSRRLLLPRGTFHPNAEREAAAT